MLSQQNNTRHLELVFPCSRRRVDSSHRIPLYQTFVLRHFNIERCKAFSAVKVSIRYSAFFLLFLLSLSLALTFISRIHALKCTMEYRFVIENLFNIHSCAYFIWLTKNVFVWILHNDMQELERKRER